MAFMMPVVKNDWDIYKSNRSRKSSECSPPSVPLARSRKISECRSEGKGSLSSTKFEGHLSKHHSVPDRMPSRQWTIRSRNSSESVPVRAKQASTPPSELASSPTKDTQQTSWLAKLKKFMKHKSEEEKCKS